MHGGSHHNKNRRVPLFIAVALVAVACVGVILVWAVRSSTRAPVFDWLADAPDHSLVGTIAYLDWQRDACLRIVPAARGEPRTVVCLAGVNAGALSELSRLDDGRIAVTMYGECQKVVDVSSGAVVDVPPPRPGCSPPSPETPSPQPPSSSDVTRTERV